MGACFNTSIFPLCSAAELKIEYKNLIEELHYEYGHQPYNGTFTTCDGLLITNEKFESVDDAEDWLMEYTDKWGVVKAVQADGKWVLGGWCAE